MHYKNDQHVKTETLTVLNALYSLPIIQSPDNRQAYNCAWLK